MNRRRDVDKVAAPKGATRYHRPGNSMRISRDWWAVLAAAALVLLIKLGVVTRVPW